MSTRPTIVVALALATCALGAGRAHAEAPQPPTLLGAGVHATSMPDGRWGLAPAATLRRMLRMDRALGLALHGGAGLALWGLTQSEQPQALAVREYDLAARLELGVTLTGPIWPSLSVGGGAAARWIRVAGDTPGGGASAINRTELLPAVDAQLSVALPVRRGTVLIEPFVRRQWVLGDARLDWAWGLDLRAALP